ncbi:hypothetical protein [Halorientalis pallida]|uniref:Ferric reductase like transmembrane component n=1 Tax=Halorientalis pallida TaxID=2479928 RepID=A0A498KUM0_9EURY|nr:hypothetical protein [Halorientalis pallida]RXK48662.1 hypothetical protein EAF64_13390 [Halorientalis pallida]
MSTLVWYLDRAAALLAYPSLYLSVLTGIFYNTDPFGTLHEAARRVHVELSVFAMLVTLLHASLGVVDAWFVLTGAVPEPSYTQSYFLVGLAVGVGALGLLVVAVLGVLDANRFDRPWGPRVVHALAYGGFVSGTVHAAAVGTDAAGLVRPLVIPSLVFLAYVLLLRGLVLSGIGPTATGQ